jgi:hypothetical protein
VLAHWNNSWWVDIDPFWHHPDSESACLKAVCIADKKHIPFNRALHCDAICKMRVKILYWSPDGELIYLENFHSLTDHIFQFNFRLWLSSLLNRTLYSDIKSFKSCTFNACKWPRWGGKKNLTKFFAKNKSVESADHETGLPVAASWEISIENTDEGSKAVSVNSKMSGSQSFRGSCMIPVTTLCTFLYCDFAERQAQIFILY